MGTAQFRMMFAHQGSSSFEFIEDEHTKCIRQDIIRAFAEDGHEVSFLPKDVMEVENLEKPEDVERIINTVMEKHGCVLCDCTEIPEDLNNWLQRQEPDFGFGNEPDFGFGSDPNFGLN